MKYFLIAVSSVLALFVWVVGEAAQLVPLVQRTSQVPSVVTTALNRPAVSQFLQRNRVAIDTSQYVASGGVGLAPVKDRWSDDFKKNGIAILGILQTTDDLTRLKVGPGVYIIQAINKPDTTIWRLLNTTNPATGVSDVPAQVENLPNDVQTPQVNISRAGGPGTARRCCFKDDHIMHCVECD